MSVCNQCILDSFVCFVSVECLVSGFAKSIQSIHSKDTYTRTFKLGLLQAKPKTGHLHETQEAVLNVVQAAE
jgi:hypothetical protein